MSSKYNLPLELTPADIIKVGSFLIMATTFVVQHHNFMVQTAKKFESIDSKISYFETFAQASDSFDSSTYGVPFRGGQPVDGSFRPDSKKFFVEQAQGRR